MKVDDSYKLKGSVYSDQVAGKDGAGKPGLRPNDVLPNDPRAMAFARMLEVSGDGKSSQSFSDFKADDKDNRLEKMLNALSDKTMPRRDNSQQILSHTPQVQARIDRYIPEKSDMNSLSDNSSQNQNAAVFMAALNGQSAFTAAAPESTAPVNAPVTSPEDVLKIADSVVERILVSDPKHSSNSQVTITFNSASALPQTEITLRRDLDGLLSIIISANNPRSFNRLVESREQIIDGVQKYEERDIRFILNGPDDLLAENEDEDNGGYPHS